MSLVKDEAAALRLGLLGGFVYLEEVIAWADGLIADDHGAAAPQLFDLALLRPGERDMGAAISLLEAIPGEVDVRAVWRRIAGDVRRALTGGRLTERLAADILFRLALDHACPDDRIRDTVYALDDGVDLALHKVYGTLASVRAEMLEHLARWSGHP